MDSDVSSIIAWSEEEEEKKEKEKGFVTLFFRITKNRTKGPTTQVVVSLEIFVEGNFIILSVNELRPKTGPPTHASKRKIIFNFQKSIYHRREGRQHVGTHLCGTGWVGGGSIYYCCGVFCFLLISYYSVDVSFFC